MEAVMTFRLQFSRLLLAVALLCTAPSISPIAYSQAAPKAPKLDITGQPIVPDIALYDDFLRNLGQEDDRIQKETQAGGAQSAGRRDFSSAIGFGKTDEQVMLAIVLDCYHQEKAKDDQLDADEIKVHISSEEFLIKSTQEEREAAYEEREKAYLQEVEPTRRAKYAILRETWNKLKNDLGEESFKKLDKYVIGRTWWHDTPGIGEIPAPTVKKPGGSYMDDLGVFRDFFASIGNEDAIRQQWAAEGKELKGFNAIPYSIPADKRQAVIAIGLEAAREIKESDQQYHSASMDFIGQNTEKYGWKKAHEMPTPPEIEAIEQNGWKIIAEHVAELKQALGEDDFMMLDNDLCHCNRSREAAATSGERGATASPSPAGAAVPHQPGNNSAPAQTQGVKP
jgi:hypothetical protein